VTVIVVTGIQAADKSTIAQALAERLARSVHLRGDVFRRMIVSGRADMGPANPPAGAIAQLKAPAPARTGRHLTNGCPHAAGFRVRPRT
jgi:predicted kinase